MLKKQTPPAFSRSPGKIWWSCIVVPDVQEWINAGYNGEKYYAYLNASWENLNTNMLVKDIHRTDWNLCLPVGYRFAHLPEKIPGIL